MKINIIKNQETQWAPRNGVTVLVVRPTIRLMTLRIKTLR